MDESIIFIVVMRGKRWDKGLQMVVAWWHSHAL